MKKFLLAICFTVLSLQYSFGQPPPTPPGCECCASESGPALYQCLDYCDNDPEGDWCSDTLPLDSNMFVLFATAILLGGYVMIKNKRKWVKN